VKFWGFLPRKNEKSPLKEKTSITMLALMSKTCTKLCQPPLSHLCNWSYNEKQQETAETLLIGHSSEKYG